MLNRARVGLSFAVVSSVEFPSCRCWEWMLCFNHLLEDVLVHFVSFHQLPLIA